MDCERCGKTEPGPTRPTCTSCLLEPLPASPKETQEAPGEAQGIDLEYLKPKKAEATKKAGKSLYQVTSGLFAQSVSKPLTRETMDSGDIKVESKYFKSEVFSAFEDLVLAFNEKGEATIKSYQLPMLEKLMAIRPGRFTIVKSPNKEKRIFPGKDGFVVEPTAKEVEKLEEQKKIRPTESGFLETPPPPVVEEVAAPKTPKAPAKKTRKRRTSKAK